MALVAYCPAVNYKIYEQLEGGWLDLLRLRGQQSKDRCTADRRGIGGSIGRSVLLVLLASRSHLCNADGMVC